MDLQAASPVTATGVYPWSVTVTATYSGGPTIVKTVSGIDPVVVNGSSGPLGPGWSVGGLDYLVSIPGSTGVATGMLYVYGTGESRFFQGSGPYTSPANDMGTLVKNMDGSFTYTNKNQVKWNFDTTGKLTTVVDPHNLTRTFTYSGGLLSTWAEPDGGVATFTYTSGLLTKVAEPGNRAVTLAYTSGNLTKIQDPDGSLESFTYDGNGRLNNDQHGPLTRHNYSGIGYLLVDLQLSLPETTCFWPLARCPCDNCHRGVLRMKRIIWGLAAWGLLLAGVVGQARADFIASATLLGANERPTPNNSLGTGTATITFLAGPDEFVYLVTFTNLSTPATAAHIHLGAATISGPVILPFPLVPATTSGSFSGVLTNANIVNQGTTGLTDISQIAAQIQANNTYVNIHSSVFPGGEIRGQLSVEPAVAGVPEPSSITLLGIGLVGIAGSAWRRWRNKFLAIA